MTTKELHVHFNPEVETIQYDPDEPPAQNYLKKRPRVSKEFIGAKEEPISPSKIEYKMDINTFFEGSQKKKVDTEKMEDWEIRQALRRLGLKTVGTLADQKRRLEKYYTKPTKTGGEKIAKVKTQKKGKKAPLTLDQLQNL
ncbi:hypothetical protein EIN_170570 [Entamoeba invadens IP1]|uniref:SAP domain-containing protein n=1 Tax=Entamoeba invadens IP1 TaxID=370355 RepID=A0A0A1TVP8_ENTIV|nr:hypothetical protein EIN_170570 [Entamoeba invadens IP1]ELP84532.1 hypothetical protein EIN_170570 [Entamoeba invadens IP1]|eukprot:XP_004183878.1 hypothetical protein EIN_170570 [Entamoeba invadens IP1]